MGEHCERCSGRKEKKKKDTSQRPHNPTLPERQVFLPFFRFGVELERGSYFFIRIISVALHRSTKEGKVACS